MGLIFPSSAASVTNEVEPSGVHRVWTKGSKSETHGFPVHCCKFSLCVFPLLLFQRSGADLLTVTFGESCVSHNMWVGAIVLPCCFAAPSSAPDSATLVSGQITSHVIAVFLFWIAAITSSLREQSRFVPVLQFLKWYGNAAPYTIIMQEKYTIKHNEISARRYRRHQISITQQHSATSLQPMVTYLRTLKHHSTQWDHKFLVQKLKQLKGHVTPIFRCTSKSIRNN